MACQHPNIANVGRFDPANLAGAARVMADAVEVFRVVDGRITEVWDILSLHAPLTGQG